MWKKWNKEKNVCTLLKNVKRMEMEEDLAQNNCLWGCVEDENDKVGIVMKDDWRLVLSLKEEMRYEIACIETRMCVRMKLWCVREDECLKKIDGVRRYVCLRMKWKVFCNKKKYVSIY